MRRILVVLPHIIRPKIHVREYGFVSYLSTKYRLTLVTIDSEKQLHEFGREPWLNQVEWIPVCIARHDRLVSAIHSWARGGPALVGLYCPSRAIRQLDKILRGKCFDLAHVQTIMLGPVCDLLDGTPKVLDFVDSLYLKLSRRAQLANRLLAKILKLEARRIHEYERRIEPKVDEFLISSQLDRNYLGVCSEVQVVPTGVALKEFPYKEGRCGKDIIFIGTLSYSPNVDAVLYFTNCVFPLIRKQVPDAQFIIVGYAPGRKVSALGRVEGVEVRGYVPDVYPYLARAAVAVAPLRMGSGIQLKVLQAMAAGTPVVATPYALGGIEAVPGVHVMVAHGQAELADAVVRLLKSPEDAVHLAREARRLVEEKYSWEVVLNKLQHIYDRLLSDRV